MKKYISIILLLICALSLSACAPQNVVIDDEIREFSFAEDRAYYGDGTPGSGVYTDGFENTTEVEITSENVAEHAKRECTIKYDTISISYDPVECIWAVNFSKGGWVEGDVYVEVAGGDQTVYMDSKGKTLLIVYGE